MLERKILFETSAVPSTLSTIPVGEVDVPDVSNMVRIVNSATFSVCRLACVWRRNANPRLKIVISSIAANKACSM
jgi:hypothetical protein